MARLLLLYATSKGQTERITRYIADRLHASGHAAEVLRVEDAPANLGLEAYDGILAGGPIYFDRHAAPLTGWLTRQGPRLAGRPLGLFTVCMSVLAGTGEAPSRVDRYTAMLAEAAGRPADATAVFAGALPYRSYNVLMRWGLKRMARGLVGRVSDDPTDTSRDHVYTDWAAVDAFATTFAGVLAAAEAPRSAILAM